MKANRTYTKQDFIAYLTEIGARFEEETINGVELVYVYDKTCYDMNAIFVPYMRVSHFNEKVWYSRYCGCCNWYRPKKIYHKAKCMTTGEES